MTAVEDQSKKFKKPGVSKNRGKKAWRKFSNIADVEKFLDTQRDDELTGGPMHEKDDSDIFQVDLTPVGSEPFIKDESVDTLLDLDNVAPAVDSGTAKKDTSWKDLKCFRTLPGGRITEPETKPHNREVLKQKSRQLRRAAQAAVTTNLQRIAKAVNLRAKGAVRKLGVGNDPVFNRDLWATSDDKQQLLDTLSANRPPARLPPTLRNKKLSTFSVVDVPHPGSSYNPVPVDHEALLAAATDNAMRKAMEEEKLVAYRKTRTQGIKTANQVWMEEMEQGLDTGKEKEKMVEVQEESSDEGSVLAHTARTDRKTKQDRKRKEKANVKDEKRLLLKAKKARENEVFNAKSILKSIRKKEAEIAVRQAKNKAKMDDPKRVLRLGRQKYEEADPDVKLKEEMTDNLRTLRPEGNLLIDRYKSLQKRNILEPRRRQKIKRKYKLKKYQIEGRKVENMK